MVMGNASGREDGEGTSGVKKTENEEGYQQPMELAQPEAYVNYQGRGGVFLDSMGHSAPHGPQVSHHPLMFTSQVAAASSSRQSEVTQVQNPAIEHNMTHYHEKQTAAIITWTYGGHQVAVTGSWDNWKEPLCSLGKDFIIMKVLPLGVYHYCFIVDEQLRYAPDLPWGCDESGSAYNILNLQVELAVSNTSGDTSCSPFSTPLPHVVIHSCDVPGYIPEAPRNLSGDTSCSPFSTPLPHVVTHSCDVPGYIPEAPRNLSEFESPPSPFSSYDNEALNDSNFRKPPPDLPPQLEMTLLNELSSATTSDQSLPRPQHTVLNHLYIQNNDGTQPVALGSTYRFRQKYVTLVLYKPSRR